MDDSCHSFCDKVHKHCTDNVLYRHDAIKVYWSLRNLHIHDLRQIESPLHFLRNKNNEKYPELKFIYENENVSEREEEEIKFN